MEAAEDLQEEREDEAPVQRLTPQQRACLLAYARSGSVDGAASTLGITLQTAKNHLSDAYARLGARSGPQAIFMVLGGETAAAQLPSVTTRPPREEELGVLRARVRILERQLRRRREEPPAPVHPETRRWTRRPPPTDVPAMVDGRITLEQLRETALRYDADMSNTSEMLMTARDWVELLSYHIAPGGFEVVTDAGG